MAGGLTGDVKGLFNSLLSNEGFIDDALRLLRTINPVPKWNNFAAALLYDSVIDVLQRDKDFPTDYDAKLDVIMGGQPFILGMPQGPDFQRDIAALRGVTPASDIPDRLVPATIAAAQKGLEGANGQIDIVPYILDITFETLCDYFGTPDPGEGQLKSWAKTLFKFLFADMNNDPTLGAEVAQVAPALRDYIDSLIAKRKASPGGDDVLGRMLAAQAAGVPGLSDLQIRSALVGFIVAGLPQPAMAVPKSLNQLLNRPDALAAAQQAAATGDDATLGAYFFEGLRFDPLAPFLVRKAAGDQKIGAGLWGKSTVKDGTLVFAMIQSAMMDGNQVKDPTVFNPNRPPSAYLSFGTGMHMCFAKAINEATIPLMLKPLLAAGNVRRAEGDAGQLVKKGPFVISLVVDYG